MYAIFVEVNIDSAMDPERKVLTEGIIPIVRQLPGVVSGQWVEIGTGHGVSIVVFESEDAAKSAIDGMGLVEGSSPAPGVTFKRIETGEVVGSF